MTAKSGTPRDDLGWLMVGLCILPLTAGMLFLDLVPEWRAQQFYVEGRCVVVAKRVREFGPSGKASNSTYRPEIAIRYTVDGQEYQDWAYDAVRASSAIRGPKERALEDFTVGQAYPCWYDPDDPSRVVLVRGYSWFTCIHVTIFLVLVFFIGKGILRRTRAARRAARQVGGAGPRPGRLGSKRMDCRGLEVASPRPGTGWPRTRD